MSLLGRARPALGRGAANGGRLASVQLGSLMQEGDTSVKVPGLAELNSICQNAKAIAKICDDLRIGSGPLDAHNHHIHTRDHPDPPWVWEL